MPSWIKRVYVDQLRSRKCFIFILLIVTIILLTQFQVLHFSRGKLPPESMCRYKRRTLAIPKIVHQSWKTLTFPNNFKQYANSWKVCFPSWEHKLWTDETNRKLVSDHFPWFLRRYDNLPHPICRADVVRYIYMYLYGGVYADLDTECMKPFAHLLNHSIVLGSMKGESLLKEGHVQNSFMFSIPKHPFWLKMLDFVANHSNNGRPEWITGPNALMKVIKEHRVHCPKDIVIYPPEYFNPFSWLNNTSKNCKSLQRMNQEKYIACKKDYAQSYVIQFHAHTWE